MDIVPIRVKDLPAFLAAIEPIAREVERGDLFAALAKSADNVIRATAIGAGVKRDWLDEQDAETLVDLASRVIEVNADFFARRVMPRLAEAAERVTRTFGDLSTIGSSPLSAPDSAIAR